MMAKGKIAFIKKWGFLRFCYAYLMLLLNRFVGFRLSVVRAKEVASRSLERLESNGFTYRSLTIEDFQNEQKNRKLDINRNFVEKALARGDQCIGALDGEQVIGYAWRTLDEVAVDHPIYMKFGEKFYYRYKGFVLPSYRGRNIFNQIKVVAESEQLEQGRTHGFGVIETHNYPSLIASKKHGDSTIGYSAYLYNRLFFVSWSSQQAKSRGVKVFRK